MPKPAILRVPSRLRPVLRQRYLRCLWEKWTVSRHEIMNYQTSYEFFNERYETQNLDDIIDGHLDWYLAPFDHFAPRLPGSGSLHALDLGCGSGSVRRWLRRRRLDWLCTGVDLAPHAASHHVNDPAQDRFVLHDLRQLETLKLDRAADVIFAVNALNYAGDLSEALKALRALAAPGAWLAVIDPASSAFWCKAPGHTQSRPEDWYRLLSEAGWALESWAILSVDRIGSKPLMPLSQSFLGRRV